MIPINDEVVIENREVQFVYGTSSGPGGQHVNKVRTKATLLFSINDSSSLSEMQKARIRSTLSTRINKSGVLRVTSSKYKSQIANRKAVIKRFVQLVSTAIIPPKKRKKTGVPKSQRKKRLDSKRIRGERKRLRSKVKPSDD